LQFSYLVPAAVAGRRTQVVKGADCKSAMRRLESARRLYSRVTASHHRPLAGGGVFTYGCAPRRQREAVWSVGEPPAPWRRRRRGPHDRAGRRELVREAFRLRAEGCSSKAIARTLGLARSTIRYWLEHFAGVAQS